MPNGNNGQLPVKRQPAATLMAFFFEAVCVIRSLFTSDGELQCAIGLAVASKCVCVSQNQIECTVIISELQCRFYEISLIFLKG